MRILYFLNISDRFIYSYYMQLECERNLIQFDEGFGIFAVSLHAPELLHRSVRFLEQFGYALARMTEAGFMFFLHDGGDIYIVGRCEMLRLLSGHHFEVVKRERAIH